MMKSQLVLSMSLLLPLACLAADAKPDVKRDTKPLESKALGVKAGLWEITITSQMSNPASQISREALRTMSPAERNRLEAEMAGRGAHPQTRIHKTCLNAGDLARPLSLGEQNKGTCERKLLSSSAQRQEYQLSCTSGPVKSTGLVRILAVNQEGLRGASRLNSTDGTRSLVVNVDFTGRWLGASCSETAAK